MKIVLVFIFLIATLSSDMKVYVSKDSSIDSITLQELKNLYLKKTKLLKDEKVVVIDNKEDYTVFYERIINKTDGQIHAYWMKQIFLGKKIPPKKIDSSEVEAMLNNNPSSISYSNENLDAKVIYENK